MENPTYPILMRKARQVAVALTDDECTWTARNYTTRYARLIRKQDGLTLCMYVDDLFKDTPSLDGKRISFSGQYPDDHYGNPYSNSCGPDNKPPTISVAGNRTPVAIASDLQRRLLPDVVAHTMNARAIADHSRRIHREKERTVRRMAKAGAADHVQIRGQGYGTDVFQCSTAFAAKEIYWKASLGYYGDSVELSVAHLTPGQALRVLRLLKSMSS